MEYSAEKERQLKDVQEQVAKLEKELLIEKVLYANMKDVLKKREEEIAGLYDINNELMGFSD